MEIPVRDVERHKPPRHGPEPVLLWSMLDYYRATVLEKCRGLDEADLARRSVPPSSLSLLGILRHSVQVERYWFERIFLGREIAAPYSTAGDPDGDFNDLGSEPASAVVARFLAQCATSREIAEGRSLDEVAALEREGETVTLRYIAIHLIEEYGRHCGHADLLREAIDGATGD